MPDSPSEFTDRGSSASINAALRGRVFRLALPALGEQFLNLCVGLFDVFLAGRVSHTVGETGLTTAAVGVAAYQSWLATLLFALIGTGTTALVARSWGAGDREQANRFTNRSIMLALLFGLVIYGLLYAVSPWYATLQKMEGRSHEIVVHYLRTDACGHVLYGCCLIGAAALRGIGDMRTSLLILGAVNLLNIAVSTSLVFGVGPIEPWGLEGVVAGTVVARLTGGLLMLAVLARGRSGLRLRRSLLVPHADDIRRILRIGAPHAADGAIMWTGQSLFVMIIARLGDADAGKAYFAAHMIGMEVEALTYLPATAWGYAAASLIGQSLGAGDFDRARRVGHEAARQASLIALAGALVYLFAAPLIFAVMTTEPAVREIGVPALRFLSWYQVPLALLIVYLYALRGAGDTRSPLIVNALGIFCVRLPLGYLFGIVLDGGLIGAWTGMCLDVVIRAAVSYGLYLRGRWMETKV